MKLARLILLAINNPSLTVQESADILDFVLSESPENLNSTLEDLHLSRLDLDDMEKDFLSIGGYKL